MTIINLLLIALGAFALLQSFYAIALSKDQITTTSTTTVREKKSTFPKPRDAKPISHYRSIAKRNLFRIQSAGTWICSSNHCKSSKNSHPPTWIYVHGGRLVAQKVPLMPLLPPNRQGKGGPSNSCTKNGYEVLTATIDAIYRNKVILGV